MRKFLRVLLLYIPGGLVALSLLLVLLFKWAPVGVTPLMVKRLLQGEGSVSSLVQRRWTPLEDISTDLVRCVIASEDARFFSHRGFDLEELKRMQAQHEKYGKPIRGCSTLSQQTAKNCFTFCSHTMLRKAVEAWYTFLIERIWGKKRIVEVYLNVAELGPGIYGAQDAARYYFHKDASKLSLTEASTLTLCLPNPLKRNPDWVRRYRSGRRAEIASLSRQVRLEF